jgi:AGCS family alanine or glycine:cation symporter
LFPDIDSTMRCARFSPSFSLLRLLVPLAPVAAASRGFAAEEAPALGKRIDGALEPVASGLEWFIFKTVPIFGQDVPVVLIILAGTALFLTLFFGFINLRAFGLAIKTVRGKYSSKDDPGQITHFQALATALSATVGLGNIAGVAIAIGIGGPGAVLWMIVMGFLGMTSKFAECTLGVKYRVIEPSGEVHGGGMFYLRDGLKERGLGPLGMVLAVIFAVACIGGALGAGNMFQANQAYAQVSETFGILNGPEQSWIFGLIVAVLVGLVIIGGIVWIARVTEFLVPFMCVTYVIACLVVLLTHAGEIPAAFGTIFREAFSAEAGFGGLVGGIIQGIRRGVFSNEAGVGSAAIAHSAVKTRNPASEGVVALLEPFVDTVVVCTMTALVIVITGMWKINADVADKEMALLAQPVAESQSLASYEEGTKLHIEETWQRVSTDEGVGGWVKAGALSAKEEVKGRLFAGKSGAKLLDAPQADAAVAATLGKREGVSAGKTWTRVKNPDDGLTGWVLKASLNERSGTSGGIWLTSQAFEGVIGWFPKILAVAVFLFAFSTMISWSYYGEQALGFLTGENHTVMLIYKLFFCVCVVLGSAASLDNVLRISDSLFFAMVVPNMIGLYVLLPVVKRELDKFRAYAKQIDSKEG